MVNHVNSNLLVIHGQGALLIGHDLYLWVLLAGLDLILHGMAFAVHLENTWRQLIDRHQ